jgi:hypothetical protein
MLESTVVLAPRLRGTEQCALCPLGAQAYKGESEMFVPISSTNTSRRASSGWTTITLQAALSHSSRSSAPTVRFFERSPSSSSVALRWSCSYPFRLCALGSDVFGRWWQLGAPLHPPLGALGLSLVYYAGSPRALFGREGASLSDTPSVSLDRREAHVEGASCLSFGHTPLYSGDYLLAQIFGIGSHSSMIAYGSTFMLTAVSA